MYPVVDISEWALLSDESVGAKPKSWCLDPDDEKFLFKQSRLHAGEHWSEKIAAEVAHLLGMPHAEIELAVRGKRLGTISRSFLPHDFLLHDKCTLHHGNELLSKRDLSYTSGAKNFGCVQHTLDNILGTLTNLNVRLPLGYPGPAGITCGRDLFIGYLLLDALIANTDRHHENWAVVHRAEQDQPSSYELAPTYDHASSLGRELTDHRRKIKLDAEASRLLPVKPSRRDQTIVGYLESDDGRSRIFNSEFDPKPLRPMEVFELAWRKHREPAEAWLNQLDTVPVDAFDSIVAEVPINLSDMTIMSSDARNFALCLLSLNRHALLSRTFRHA